MKGNGKKRSVSSQHTPCKRVRGGAAADSAAGVSPCVSNQVVVISDGDSDTGDDPVIVPAPPAIRQVHPQGGHGDAPAQDAAPAEHAAAPAEDVVVPAEEAGVAAPAQDAAAHLPAVLAGIQPHALTAQGASSEASALVERQCNDLTDAPPAFLEVLGSVTAQVCSPVV